MSHMTSVDDLVFLRWQSAKRLAKARRCISWEKTSSQAIRVRDYRAMWTLTLAITSMVILCGCALQRYRAEPLDPPKSAASLEARSLAAPALRDYFATELKSEPPWPPANWNLADLTLAALYYNPAIQIARKHVLGSDAAIITAKTRPNPTLSGELGGETAPESPWLAGLGFSLPIETAGKRKYRTAEAERLADVARWDLASTAWNVRAQVRAALTEFLAANESLGILQSEEALRAEQVRLYQERFSVGMIPQPELALARTQYTESILAERTAEGRVSLAQATLAAAIGVPTSATESIRIAWPQFDTPPTLAQLNPGTILDDAVLNRLDIRRSLAAYSAADAALRLEIAQQYPNFDIGPNYAYEEGSHLFSIPVAVALPIFNRNQGPIAEADAQRQQMAAEFQSVQATGIADTEQALAKYKAAVTELAQARTLLDQSRAQEESTQRALSAGQSDRVALNSAQLQTAITQAAELDALYKAQQALGDLENAVQRPLLPGDILPITPESPALNPSARK